MERETGIEPAIQVMLRLPADPSHRLQGGLCDHSRRYESRAGAQPLTAEMKAQVYGVARLYGMNVAERH